MSVRWVYCIFIVHAPPCLLYTDNTQIEGFIKDHGGPGIQHVGLHTTNMIKTVVEMTKNGVKFRHPPPTYYTEVRVYCPLLTNACATEFLCFKYLLESFAPLNLFLVFLLLIVIVIAKLTIDWTAGSNQIGRRRCGYTT